MCFVHSFGRKKYPQKPADQESVRLAQSSTFSNFRILARPTVRVKMNISREQGWNLQGVLRHTRQFQRCYVTVRFTDLVPAANIRPILPDDEQMWYDILHMGFDCDEHYVRAYVDEEHAEALTKLVEGKEFAGKRGEARPTLGVISAEEAKLGKLHIVDGAHRATAEGSLRKRHREWVAANNGKDEDDSPFLWVRVLLYTHEMVPHIAMLAKACNDETGIHTAETQLSRFTLMQQVINGLPKKVVKGKAKALSQKDCYQAVLTQAGVTGAKEQKAKANYTSQLVGIAQAIAGEVTEWLVSRYAEFQRMSNKQIGQVPDERGRKQNP